MILSTINLALSAWRRAAGGSAPPSSAGSPIGLLLALTKAS